jgi:hypothetical protein
MELKFVPDLFPIQVNKAQACFQEKQDATEKTGRLILTSSIRRRVLTMMANTDIIRFVHAAKLPLISSPKPVRDS